LTYPSAEILVPAVEHAFWMDEGEMNRASPGRVQTNQKRAPRVQSRGDETREDLRVGQGGNSRGHPKRHARPHTRPYFVCDRFGPRQRLRAIRRDPRAFPVRASSRLARLL